MTIWQPHRLATVQTSNDTEHDLKVSLMNLKRLLHCMEQNEAPKNQSWRSILMRADMAQESWNSIVTIMNNNNNNNENTLIDPIIYRQYATRVDQASRRAKEIATKLRHESETIEPNNNNNAMQTEAIVNRIFSKPSPMSLTDESSQNSVENQQQKDNENEEGSDNYGIQDEFDLAGDEPENGDHLPNSAAGAATTEAEPSVEELQKMQREQIEEAIAQMASQMKEATKGIQQNIQKQTDGLLDEMEDVASKKAQELIQVTQNVNDHNRSRWSQEFGTWTILFSIVGIFAFCLVTVFTVPKHRGACLFFCPKHATTSQPQHEGNGFIMNWIQSLASNEDDDEYNRHEDENHNMMSSQYDNVYKETEYEQQEKERLQELMEELKRLDEKNHIETNNEPTNKAVKQKENHDAENIKKASKNTYMASPDLENRWDNPTRVKTENYSGYVGHGEKRRSSLLEDVRTKNNIEVSFTANGDECDMDMEGNCIPTNTDYNYDDDDDDNYIDDDYRIVKDFNSNQPGSINNMDNDATKEQKRRRISPKDIRVAASNGDVTTLKSYLNSKPEYINRQDKNGWAPLHMAILSGHVDATKFLLQQDECDIHLANQDGSYPIDIAKERLGHDHIIVTWLQQLSAGMKIDFRLEDSHDSKNNDIYNEDDDPAVLEAKRKLEAMVKSMAKNDNNNDQRENWRSEL